MERTWVYGRYPEKASYKGGGNRRLGGRSGYGLKKKRRSRHKGIGLIRYIQGSLKRVREQKENVLYQIGIEREEKSERSVVGRGDWSLSVSALF